MPLDYLSQIKPLEDAGKTDVQIAAHFSQLTAQPISCTQAKIALEEAEVIIEDPITGIKSGPLIERYNAIPDGPAKKKFGWFISHVFGRGDQISSDTQPRAADVVDAIGGLPGPLQPVGAAILTLGGGQPYAGTAAADIAQARTDWQTAEAQRLADEAARQAEEQAAREHSLWNSDFLGRYNSTIAPVLDARPRDNAALVAALQALATDLQNNPWSP